MLMILIFSSKVEDGEYFQTLPENTIFILLRPGEAWGPAGEDIVSQGHHHYHHHYYHHHHHHVSFCCSCVNNPEDRLRDVGSSWSARGNTFLEDHGQQGLWSFYDDKHHDDDLNDNGNYLNDNNGNYLNDGDNGNYLNDNNGNYLNDNNDYVSGEDHRGAALGEGTPSRPTSCTPGA